jgi:hypothetical protein
MGNRKIDQLPNYTGDTSGVHVVINNPSNTTTYTVTKETFLDGNNTFHGNQVISGSLSISGTTEFGGDLVPKIARGATLGTNERPFRDLYLQSASINIQSDIIGGRNATISNADGNVTIQAAGFQLKSGSFVSFEVDEFGFSRINTPTITTTQAGLMIVGSSDGSIQPAGGISTGRMVHITGNDGTSARFTMDAFGTNSFASFVGRSARGTAASPLPLQVGDIMTRISATGWAESGYNTTNTGGPVTSIDFVATDNYTHDTYGSKIQLYTSPSGSGNIARKLSAEVDSTGLNLPTGSDFKIGGNSYTASLATTGSNRFNGNQTITGSLSIQSGSAFPQSTGSSLVTYNQTTGQLAHAKFESVISSLFSYGQFSDSTTQSGSANTEYSMRFNSTDLSNNISIVSGSRITFAKSGIYNLQFSAQFVNTDNSNENIDVWFALTGSNIPNSNTRLAINKAQAGNKGEIVAAWNILLPVSASNYAEIKWSTTGTNIQLLSNVSSSLPTRPGIPSVIATVTQLA